VISKARDKGIGVLIAGAYATGILAKGSADPAARYRYREPSDEIRDQVARIEAFCARWGCTLPRAAVHFCLRGPASHAAMVLGARSPGQVLGNVRAAEEAIPAGFWGDLEAMMEGRSRG
jgi:aryl-alcohol dehydrogenase-like predicted oxidoreductase